MTTHPKRKKWEPTILCGRKSFRDSSLPSHLKSWSVPFVWRLGRKILLSVAVLIFFKNALTRHESTETTKLPALLTDKRQTDMAQSVKKAYKKTMYVDFFFFCWHGWCRDPFKLAWDPLEIWKSGPWDPKEFFLSRSPVFWYHNKAFMQLWDITIKLCLFHKAYFNNLTISFTQKTTCQMPSARTPAYLIQFLLLSSPVQWYCIPAFPRKVHHTPKWL